MDEELVYLEFVVGLTPAEIASVVGVDEPSVRRQRRRALAAMARRLARAEFAFPHREERVRACAPVGLTLPAV